MKLIEAFVCDFDCRRLADGTCALCYKHGCADHLPQAASVGLRFGGRWLPMPEMAADGSFSLGSGEVNDKKIDYVAAVESALCVACAKTIGTVVKTFTNTPLKIAIDAVLDEIRAKLAEHALKTPEGFPPAAP